MMFFIIFEIFYWFFFVLGMCSIAYEPCDENSFKIGPPVTESKPNLISNFQIEPKI